MLSFARTGFEDGLEGAQSAGRGSAGATGRQEALVAAEAACWVWAESRVSADGSRMGAALRTGPILFGTWRSSGGPSLNMTQSGGFTQLAPGQQRSKIPLTRWLIGRPISHHLPNQRANAVLASARLWSLSLTSTYQYELVMVGMELVRRGMLPSNSPLQRTKKYNCRRENSKGLFKAVFLQ